MAYVTYKNRTSADYRFTTTDLNDPMIAELKEMLTKENVDIKRARKRFPNSIYPFTRNTKGIRIRPRGPRTSVWAKDTPWENATHYDVYVREYK